ncbi:MAG: 23S rRNA (pseudouridine(1915)-N(3))-methyltransferase RlmH [Ruminococcus sp.]|nr:23S rRNA (pseudouridine(1915)-N(3))-methyltransferase RlmH [Ruminococcus sp.]
MIRINIICVGKLKEKYLRDASAEYEKRLSGFCKLNIIELSEAKLPSEPNDSEISKALTAEGEAMEQYLDAGSCYNIAMCIEGKQMTSEKLSKEIEKCGISGSSTINFIIGSSFGIDEKTKKKVDLKLSMSEMTFPHQLARIMLLEQIYRAFQISVGSRYHK